jgi:hypothetical protein
VQCSAVLHVCSSRHSSLFAVAVLLLCGERSRCDLRDRCSVAGLLSGMPASRSCGLSLLCCLGVSDTSCCC